MGIDGGEEMGIDRGEEDKMQGDERRQREEARRGEESVCDIRMSVD